MTKEINPTTIGDVYGLNQAAEPTVNKIDQVSGKNALYRGI